MPWIKFKRWSYLTPLAPHVAVCGSGQRYLWNGDQGGATLVDRKADVEELLNPPGGQPSDYEVAWERYGVTFDARGQEMVHDTPPVTVPGPNTKPQETRASTTARPVGRPRK